MELGKRALNKRVMRGLVDCWTVWMTTVMLYVLCACPLDVGIVLCVFASCFAYPM